MDDEKGSSGRNRLASIRSQDCTKFGYDSADGKLLILELTPFQIEGHDSPNSESINILTIPRQKTLRFRICVRICWEGNKEMIGTGPALANISGYVGLAEHS